MSMVNGLLHFLLPASVWYWVAGLTGTGGLAVLALWALGGKSLVTNAADVAGAAAKPLAAQAGTMLAELAGNLKDWLGEGMKGIWDNPAVLVPMILALGISCRYIEGGEIAAASAAKGQTKAVRAELAQCQAQVKKAAPASSRPAARRPAVKASPEFSIW